MTSDDPEDEIRARLVADDSRALDMIWTSYSSDLFGYLVSILCSREEAEDALQDVFVLIARKRSALARARRIKPYLFRISRNVALNRIKRDRRRRGRERGAPPWLQPGREVEGSPRLHQVEAAVAALPEKQRVVIVLKVFDEKTFREIADMLDVSIHTAASRYRYGLNKLKIALETDPL